MPREYVVRRTFWVGVALVSVGAAFAAVHFAVDTYIAVARQELALPRSYAVAILLLLFGIAALALALAGAWEWQTPGSRPGDRSPDAEATSVSAEPARAEARTVRMAYRYHETTS